MCECRIVPPKVTRDALTKLWQKIKGERSGYSTKLKIPSDSDPWISSNHTSTYIGPV